MMFSVTALQTPDLSVQNKNTSTTVYYLPLCVFTHACVYCCRLIPNKVAFSRHKIPYTRTFSFTSKTITQLCTLSCSLFT